MSVFLQLLRKNVGLLTAVLVCLTLAVLFHTSGGQDDTYITYWPARTLAEYGQILNYNGQRIEQSSSLSLVVVLGVLYKLLPLSLPTVGYATGLGFAAVTLILAARTCARLGYAGATFVVLPLGTVTCFAYWATSGMETTLVTASELWLVLELDRLNRAGFNRRSALSVLAGTLFVASRPESPAIAAALVVGLGIATLLMWRPSGRPQSSLSGRGLLRVAAVVTGSIALVIAFRRAYFGAWVPNPATMKAPGFNWEEGLAYVWDAVIANGAHWLAAFLVAIAGLVMGVLRRTLPSPLLVMVTCLAGAHLGFAVFSGGDWMTGARFLAFAMPSLVLSTFAVGGQYVRDARVTGAIAAVFALANLVCTVQGLRRGESDGRPLWTATRLNRLFVREIGEHDFARIELGNKLHLRDAATLQRFLPVVERIVAAKKRPVWVMTGQAGMLGYHLMSRHFGHAKLLDLWSLTTRELYECFPRGAVQGGKWGSWIGLEDAFRQLSAGRPDCRAPMPDIYYNECLTHDARATLQRHGYVVLYEQIGNVPNSRKPKLFAGTVAGCGHFAVRAPLVAELGLEPIPTYNWSIAP